MNNLVYNLYLSKDLFPFSLKQINTKSGIRTELSNIPGTILDPLNAGKIVFSQCNLTLNTKEIGVFNVKNISSNKNVTFQDKGYPESSFTTQIEITNDGSNSGGRLGKVPSDIIKDIFETFGQEKINPKKEFGYNFEKITKIKVQKYFNWYLEAKKYAKIVPVNFKNSNDMYNYLLNLINSDPKSIKIIAHKIQGLQMQWLLATRSKEELSQILTRIVYGAKKINVNSGFFIKVY